LNLVAEQHALEHLHATQVAAQASLQEFEPLTSLIGTRDLARQLVGELVHAGDWIEVEPFFGPLYLGN
jgi:hypothetical protein